MRSGQSHLRFLIQRGMAAGEHQPQAVVLEFLRSKFSHRKLPRNIEGKIQFRVTFFAPRAIDQLAKGDRCNPRPRIPRNALARPCFERRGEGVLHGFFSQIEGAGPPDQSCDDAARLLPKDSFDGFRDQPNTMIGRTSTEPWDAAGIRAAQPMASSRSLHSSR